MLIVINGTIGVAKTSVSMCLANEIVGAVYLEGDELAFTSHGEFSQRIRQRGRPRAEAEIVDSKRLRQSQDRMRWRGVEIDTNGKSAEEVAARIKKILTNL